MGCGRKVTRNTGKRRYAVLEECVGCRDEHGGVFKPDKQRAYHGIKASLRSEGRGDIQSNRFLQRIIAAHKANEEEGNVYKANDF